MSHETTEDTEIDQTALSEQPAKAAQNNGTGEELAVLVMPDSPQSDSEEAGDTAATTETATEPSEGEQGEDVATPAEDSELRAALEAEDTDPEASRRFLWDADSFVVTRPGGTITTDPENPSATSEKLGESGEPGDAGRRIAPPAPKRGAGNLAAPEPPEPSAASVPDAENLKNPDLELLK